MAEPLIYIVLALILIFAVDAIKKRLVKRKKSATAPAKAKAPPMQETPISPPAPEQEPTQRQFKFCPECGAKLEDGDTFCPECGTKLD